MNGYVCFFNSKGPKIFLKNHSTIPPSSGYNNLMLYQETQFKHLYFFYCVGLNVVVVHLFFLKIIVIKN